MQVQFFEDQGRFLRDSFHGYRAVVTRPDRSRFWADLPEAGAPSYIEVNLADLLIVGISLSSTSTSLGANLKSNVHCVVRQMCMHVYGWCQEACTWLQETCA